MKKYFAAAFLGILLAVLHAPRSTPVLFQKFSSKAYPGGFSVNITSNATLPIEAGKPFTLEANITMENASGEFEFQWLLPEGVSLVSGELEPTLAFGASSSAQTKVTLMITDARYNYQIVGEAYRMNQQGTRGAVAQFNTNPSSTEKERLPNHKAHRMLQ